MPKSQFMEGLRAGIAARDRRLEREAADRAHSMQYLLQNRQLGQTDVAQAERERAARAQEQQSRDLLKVQQDQLAAQVRDRERDDLFTTLKEVSAGRFAPVPTETIEAPFTGVEIEPQQQIAPGPSVGIEVGNQRFAPTSPEYQTERAANLLSLQEGIRKRTDREERQKFLADRPDFANYLGPWDRIQYELEGKVPNINTMQEKIVNDIQNKRIDPDKGMKIYLDMLKTQAEARLYNNPNFNFNQTVRASAGQIIQESIKEMATALKKTPEQLLQELGQNDTLAKQLETHARAKATQLGDPKLVTSVSEELRTLRPPQAGKPKFLEFMKNYDPNKQQ
jgi:hypothetical protein